VERPEKTLARIVLLLSALAGCKGSPSPPPAPPPGLATVTPHIELSSDNQTFAAHVAQVIPRGTHIMEAKRILEANGFRIDWGDGEDSQFLVAARSEPMGFSTSLEYRVTVYYEGDAVTSVTARSYGLGP
jgi:hypothetical protein